MRRRRAAIWVVALAPTLFLIALCILNSAHTDGPAPTAAPAHHEHLWAKQHQTVPHLQSIPAAVAPATDRRWGKKHQTVPHPPAAHGVPNPQWAKHHQTVPRLHKPLSKLRTAEHNDILTLVSDLGSARIRLRRSSSPQSYKYIQQLLTRQPSTLECSFYRAEPVPSFWGSTRLPDSYTNGRWGPPYALLQGRLSGTGLHVASFPREDSPIIERGMVAWAGGIRSSVHAIRKA